VQHVAWIRKIRNFYKHLIGRPERQSIGNAQITIEINYKEIDWEGVD
jgi:hypothetical protein